MANSVVQMGRVVRDPVVRNVSNQYKVANLTIVVRAAGDKVDGTQKDGFFEVEAWGTCADLAEKYIKKGKVITVTGALKQHKWVDDKGNNRDQIKIVASNFGFVPGTDSNNTDGDESDLVSQQVDDTDDIDPFA